MKVLKYGVIIFCCFFSFITFCLADKYDGVIYQAEKIPGIYFYKHRNDTESIKYETHNFHEQARVYRRSSDNHIVYCIESWAPLTGAENGDYEQVGGDYTRINLTKKEYDKIRLIIYYGYGYKESRYDHTDLKWYAITQYMIWNIEAPHIEHYFVDSISSKDPIYPYEDEIAEIETLIKQHEIMPSFKDEKIEVGVGENAIIKDTNNVLDQFEVINNNDMVKIVDNSLVINSDIVTSGIIRLKRKSVKYNYDNILYVSDNFQDAISLGKFPDDIIEIPYSIKGGKILVKKVGEKIVGIDESNGELNFNIEYVNLSGVTLSLRAGKDIVGSNGEVIYRKDELINQWGTDSSGAMSFDLPYGDYYIVEENGVSGYLQNNEPLFFSVNANYQDVIITNRLQELRLFLEKRGEIFNSEDTKPLGNVIYGLYNSADINFDDKIIPKDTLLKKFETDENGIIDEVLTLPYGSYYIKEIASVPWYDIDDTKYEFEFTFVKNSTINEIDLNQLFGNDYFINYLKRGTLNVLKRDSSSNQVLSGAKFGVYSLDHELLLEVVTDSSGKVNIQLPYGRYYLQELTAPVGYIIDSKKYFLDIDEHLQIVELEITNEELEIVNVPNTGINTKDLVAKLVCVISGIGVIWVRKLA